MRQFGKRGRHLNFAEHMEIRRRVADGELFEIVAKEIGCSTKSIQRVMVRSGGVKTSARPRSSRRLSEAEREEISRGLDAMESLREIAARLHRAPSTLSREVAANGGRKVYRAWRAEKNAVLRARRPKREKLSTSVRLRREVERGLSQRWSPQQIAARLVADYPDDVEMRVSHETIYRSLFVQARGALRKELTAYLRTGRTQRRSHKRTHLNSGRLANMVMISDRPAEVEDRAIPGHWEGDLVIGKNGLSAIGTLVERKSRYVVLLHLPHGRTAPRVREALTRALRRMPETLRRTLTWDQGKEMAEHIHFAVETNINVYFCDPHSPWQRGTNENTNGLLRQYFPNGVDLSTYTRRDLDTVARELNDRPRQTLGWMKPSELFAQSVAITA